MPVSFHIFRLNVAPVVFEQNRKIVENSGHFIKFNNVD